MTVILVKTHIKEPTRVLGQADTRCRDFACAEERDLQLAYPQEVPALYSFCILLRIQQCICCYQCTFFNACLSRLNLQKAGLSPSKKLNNRGPGPNELEREKKRALTNVHANASWRPVRAVRLVSTVPCPASSSVARYHSSAS